MPCEPGSDRLQLKIKTAAARLATANDISGSGIITRVSLSRVPLDFIVQGGLPTGFTSELASNKKNASWRHHPKRFRFK